MSAKMNVPELRFREFSGEWEEKKLGDLGKFQGGGTPDTTKEQYWNGSIPWISSSDLIDNDIKNIKINRFINEISIKESATKLIPKDSILFISRVGVGKLAIATRDLCTSQDFTNLTLKKDSSKYIGYYFLANKSLLIRYSQGTSIKGFTTTDIKTLKLHLPSKPEQEKIASFLSSVDSKIEQLSKKRTLLEQYKKGAMQRIFSQTLRFKADDGSDFSEWVEKKLGDLPIIISDGNYGEQYPTSEDFKPAGVAFLRANNIKNLKIDDSDTKFISKEQHSILTSGHLKTNDILITTRGELGNIALVDSQHDGSNINAQICLLRISDKKVLSYLYLLYILDYRDSKKQYKSFETGTALKQLPKGNLRKIRLKIPSLKEQTKIANFLSALDKKIELTDKELNATKEFKKALLQKMFV